MTDDRVLEAVRTGLDGAHMNRPVSSIFHRTRARRRLRFAGGAVALAASLAVALPFVHNGSAGPAPATAPSSVTLQPVSFTLVQASDGRYTFDVVPGVPLDLPAVERALANIGITAIVRLNEKCDGTPMETPGRLFHLNVHPDDSISITLDAHRFPADGTVSITLGLDSHGVMRMAGFSLYRTGTQTGCSAVTVGPVS